MTTVADQLLTADQFAKLPADGQVRELVRGRIIVVNQPSSRHGQLCRRASRLIGDFAEDRGLGHILTNDSGVVTERDPETVRGADVAFYSFARVPPGPLPDNGYVTVPPDLVIEVRSPSDKWPKILAKVAEYLEAGVTVVCVLDPVTQTAHVYRSVQMAAVLTADQELSIPDLLPNFSERVGRFFE